MRQDQRAERRRPQRGARRVGAARSGERPAVHRPPRAPRRPLTYDGEQYDADSGLVYLRARYYDPRTGRFLTQDTMPSPNPYVYASNDPVGRVDPTGMEDLGEEVEVMAIEDDLAGIEDMSPEAQLVQRLAQQAADGDLRQLATQYLSKAEQEAMNDVTKPFLRRIFLGTAIHRYVEDQLLKMGLNVVYRLEGPDFLFNMGGDFIEVELTTVGGVAAHAARLGYDMAEIVSYLLEL